MNLSEYQEKARSTAIYLDIEGSQMIYPALGLVGECGEIAEKVKKIIRDDTNLDHTLCGNITPERAEAIAGELGDCCWYLANICCDINLALDMIYKMRGASIIQQVRKLVGPRLVLHMNRHAAVVAEALEQWYYTYDCRIGETGQFSYISNHLSHIIACIEEMANRCGFTLEEIYTANIKKLAGRKQRGTLHGEGDVR